MFSTSLKHSLQQATVKKIGSAPAKTSTIGHLIKCAGGRTLEPALPFSFVSALIIPEVILISHSLYYLA